MGPLTMQIEVPKVAKPRQMNTVLPTTFVFLPTFARTYFFNLKQIFV